jgi:serine/threonine protein kinase
MLGLAGKTLDRYVLGQRVGKGGMADVYLGYDPYFQRAIAIKIFKQDNDGMLQRFMREARIMASLHHPHLMPIYDTGESEVDGLTRYYIVMPFIDGGTLGTRIRHSMLSVEDVSKYLLDIATALDYIHKHGIIHRDIKSTNVLLSTDDLCYLSDLGVARLVNDVYTFTSTGNVLGTVDYIAPELFVGNNKADALSDIYSLGILLFEMVTGRRPFAAENQVALASMHVNEPPPLARTLVATISPAVEQVLLKGLEKDPARRFPTATAMAEAFEQATKMPHNFIPETPSSSEYSVPDIANGIELPDQLTAKQVAQVPITADFLVSANAQNKSATLDIAPITPIAKHTRARTRMLTPLLIVLLFAIAVPTAWVLGQMRTTTTAVIQSAGGAVMPSINATSGTLPKKTTDIPTATSNHKNTPVPALSLTPIVSPTPMPSPLPQVQPSSATTSSRSATPVPFPGNLVQDPGYEMQSSTQVGLPWVGVGNASILLNSGQTHSGNNASRIVPPADNSWSDIEQTVNIKTNTTYTLSVYIYTSNALNTNSTIFDVTAVHGPGLEEVHYAPSPSGYTQISLTFNSQSYNAVRIRIGLVGLQSMWVQVDDWYLHS